MSFDELGPGTGRVALHGCYFCFFVKDCSIGKQLYFARLISGKTQNEVAKTIGCDASNLRRIELGRREKEGVNFFIRKPCLSVKVLDL